MTFYWLSFFIFQILNGTGTIILESRGDRNDTNLLEEINSEGDEDDEPDIFEIKKQQGKTIFMLRMLL